MDTAMFTPSQQVLLSLFDRDRSEETAMELRKYITRFFLDKADNESDRLWEAGVLSQEKLDGLKETDLHAEMRERRPLGHGKQ